MKNVVLWNISEGVSIIQKSTCHAVFGKQMLFSWATRIRTLKMTESESVALPFGDSPLFIFAALTATAKIIIHIIPVEVKHFFYIFLYPGKYAQISPLLTQLLHWILTKDTRLCHGIWIKDCI